MSAGSFRVFNYMGCQLLEQHMSKSTHEHEYRTILALPAPVLRGMSVVADPIRLSKQRGIIGMDSNQ
jgi:hypothetical protein